MVCTQHMGEVMNLFSELSPLLKVFFPAQFVQNTNHTFLFFFWLLINISFSFTYLSCPQKCISLFTIHGSNWGVLLLLLPIAAIIFFSVRMLLFKYTSCPFDLVQWQLYVCMYILDDMNSHIFVCCYTVYEKYVYSNFKGNSTFLLLKTAAAATTTTRICKSCRF